MRVLAIGDPHLSRRDPKPMDVFGPHWGGHPDAFFDGWRAVVRDDDLVLVPGDVSWALRFEAARDDLDDLAALPGRKVLLRGNHDYWWPAIGKLRAALPAGMWAVQNDAVRIDGVVVAGTRGWTCPGSPGFAEEDRKIFDREVGRLELSLAAARDLAEPGDVRIVMLHFPPTTPSLEGSALLERIEAFAPDALVYAHVHGPTPPPTPVVPGVRVVFAAADALRFRPALVWPPDAP